MANQHLITKMVCRSKGQSAVKEAALVSRERLLDERCGVVRNFRHLRKDLRFSAILAPEGAPTWVHDREILWNRAEAKRHRKYQPARTFFGALPIGVGLEKQKLIVERFVRDVLVSEGRVVDIAIHRPPGSKSYHVHLVTTTASILEDGFGNKLTVDGAIGWSGRLKRIRLLYHLGWKEATEGRGVIVDRHRTGDPGGSR